MKQIEVRLALVLYGGVSLSIYMHGVTREFLNLLRASKAFRDQRRQVSGSASKQGGSSPADNDKPSPQVSAYMNIFEALGSSVELRVIVDIIAGASAGGINGVMLARAIAHDLSLDDHRTLWLKYADVTELTDPPKMSGRVLKGSVAPVIDRVFFAGLKAPILDQETREKLRKFVQARWFSPPFSGSRFIGWMLDACKAMDKTARPGGTLLPPGHKLDLFVTLTDFQGHVRRIRLDDPPFIDEKEHRRILNFSCLHRLSGELESGFGPDEAPSLVFAARATSSFPGAFPPASIEEMVSVLSERKMAWPGRDNFIRNELDCSQDEAQNRYFVDGSVVMNKPFAPVIDALGDRPATREVVRRIVYVDPLPQKNEQESNETSAPGFFKTILAALAQIPRNEPIGDDLLEIEQQNSRARRIAEVISAADPAVEKQVEKILGTQDKSLSETARISAFREQANALAHVEAGYANISYQTLKLRSLTERLAALIAALAKKGGFAAADPDQLFSVLEVWIASLEAQSEEKDNEAGSPPIIAFLRGMDVDFRVRRLRFVIRRLNLLYREDDSEDFETWVGAIDELKATLYELIEQLDQCWNAETYSNVVCKAARRAARSSRDDLGPLAALMPRLQKRMDLMTLDCYHDDVFSVMALNYLSPNLRHQLVTAYIGFAFYDLITFPILQSTDLAEINEVLIDRISPEDARNLSAEPVQLRGMELFSFGAFFNRSWREHDYLWGRLNAADRLVSIIQSSVGDRHAAQISADTIRRNLFLTILDEEESNLLADPDLVENVRKEVLARFAGNGDAVRAGAGSA